MSNSSYWSNKLEVIGHYACVQRIFEDYYNWEPNPCEGGGAALDLERVRPIPELIRGTRIDTLAKHYHALNLMPTGDLNSTSRFYRNPVERARIQQELASLSDAQREEVARMAIVGDADLYQTFGALDEEDWRWRFWGCNENSYSRQGGVLDPDERGVRLTCSFSTLYSWPKGVLEYLVRAHQHLTFVNEATNWYGDTIFMFGSYGRTSYKEVIQPSNVDPDL